MCVLAVKRRSLHTLASGWRAPVESIPEAQTRPVLASNSVLAPARPLMPRLKLRCLWRRCNLNLGPGVHFPLTRSRSRNTVPLYPSRIIIARSTPLHTARHATTRTRRAPSSINFHDVTSETHDTARTMAEPSRRKANETNGKAKRDAQHQLDGVHQLDGAVHSIEQKLEEQAELHARNPQEQKEAGLFQLVICVAGIYGSL